MHGPFPFWLQHLGSWFDVPPSFLCTKILAKVFDAWNPKFWPSVMFNMCTYIFPMFKVKPHSSEKKTVITPMPRKRSSSRQLWSLTLQGLDPKELSLNNVRKSRIALIMPRWKKTHNHHQMLLGLWQFGKLKNPTLMLSLLTHPEVLLGRLVGLHRVHYQLFQLHYGQVPKPSYKLHDISQGYHLFFFLMTRCYRFHGNPGCGGPQTPYVDMQFLNI